LLLVRQSGWGVFLFLVLWGEQCGGLWETRGGQKCFGLAGFGIRNSSLPETADCCLLQQTARGLKAAGDAAGWLGADGVWGGALHAGLRAACVGDRLPAPAPAPVVARSLHCRKHSRLPPDPLPT